MWDTVRLLDTQDMGVYTEVISTVCCKVASYELTIAIAIDIADMDAMNECQ